MMDLIDRIALMNYADVDTVLVDILSEEVLANAYNSLPKEVRSDIHATVAKNLRAFAEALVRAVREECPTFVDEKAIVLAEREACAAFLDEYAERYQSIAERQGLGGDWIMHSKKCLVEFLADKIRER